MFSSVDAGIKSVRTGIIYKYLYTYPIVVSSSTHSSRTRDAADHVDCLGTRACVRGEDSARGGKGGGACIHAPLFFGAPVPESFEGMRWSLLRGVLAVVPADRPQLALVADAADVRSGLLEGRHLRPLVPVWVVLFDRGQLVVVG